MKKHDFKPDVPTKHLITGLFAFSSLLLSSASPIQAACLPGANWVSNCQPGTYNFYSRIILNLDIDPQFLPLGLPTTVFPTYIEGPRKVILGSPVDAITGDPILGNVGTADGQLNVVRAETFVSVAQGQPPFLGGRTVTVITGDGVPDLQPTPSDTPPYEALSATDVIVQRTDDPTLADGIFNLFIEAQGTFEGNLRVREPLVLKSTTPLTKFPFDKSINFVSTNVNILYTAGSDGHFWTGDEIPVAKLTPNAEGNAAIMNLTSIPEPSMGLATCLIGLGILLKRKKHQP
jgi:hypothetical protein